jgi:hypothetical protein
VIVLAFGKEGAKQRLGSRRKTVVSHQQRADDRDAREMPQSSTVAGISGGLRSFFNS